MDSTPESTDRMLDRTLGKFNAEIARVLRAHIHAFTERLRLAEVRPTIVSGALKDVAESLTLAPHGDPLQNSALVDLGVSIQVAAKRLRELRNQKLSAVIDKFPDTLQSIENEAIAAEHQAVVAEERKWREQTLEDVKQLVAKRLPGRQFTSQVDGLAKEALGLVRQGYDFELSVERYSEQIQEDKGYSTTRTVTEQVEEVDFGRTDGSSGGKYPLITYTDVQKEVTEWVPRLVKRDVVRERIKIVRKDRVRQKRLA